jgi:hypothetical protein
MDVYRVRSASFEVRIESIPVERLVPGNRSRSWLGSAFFLGVGCLHRLLIIHRSAPQYCRLESVKIRYSQRFTLFWLVEGGSDVAQ